MKVLSSNENFLAIGEEYSSLKNSKIAILPAPYEHTVSYGQGAGKGPEALIAASAFVEFYDEEFGRELCFEKGIATIQPIDFGEAVDKEALGIIESHVAELLGKGKFAVTLGGEHTISAAPVKAHLDKYPEMSVLQFDAHSDLRDTYEGTKYSHACVMARVAEFLNPQKITQIGIRALCKEEADFIKSSGANTFFASAIRKGEHGENWQRKAVETLSDEIYITFDVDYFDPAIMPSTGTPEPGGFFYDETISVFREIIRAGKKIVGMDIVELAPIQGLPHSDITAARLLYKALNFAF